MPALSFRYTNFFDHRENAFGADAARADKFGLTVHFRGDAKRDLALS
jgi:hypothetical protein